MIFFRGKKVLKASGICENHWNYWIPHIFLFQFVICVKIVFWENFKNFMMFQLKLEISVYDVPFWQFWKEIQIFSASPQKKI